MSRRFNRDWNKIGHWMGNGSGKGQVDNLSYICVMFDNWPEWVWVNALEQSHSFKVFD